MQKPFQFGNVTERAEHCPAKKNSGKNPPSRPADFKGRQVVVKSKQIYLILIAVLALIPLLQTRASAELRIQPGLTLSEEYNDNIFLTPENPEHDYITRVMPSIQASYSAPIWEWDLAYTFDFRYYERRTRTDDSTHVLTLRNHTSVIRDFIFIDLKDDYRRVSLDTTRDYTLQSLFLNQTDTNEFSFMPYARLNLSTHTTGTTGYQYRNVWYKEPSAIDKTEHIVFADIMNELSARTSLGAGVKSTREMARTVSYTKMDAYAGPRFEYAEGSHIWLTLGNSWFSSINQDRGTQVFWDAGISHRFISYVVGFNAALTYIDDPTRIQRREDKYVGTFRKEGERYTLSATAGRWEYRNVLTKHLQNTRNGIAGTVGYFLSEALQVSYSGNIDRYEDNQADTFTMVYLNTARLEYTFPASTVLALDYRFEHGYSPDVVNYGMNYDNNRILLEVRKLF